MVKRKAVAPKKVSTDVRQQLTWNMGESSHGQNSSQSEPSSTNLPDLIDDSELTINNSLDSVVPFHVEFETESQSPKKKKKVRKSKECNASIGNRLKGLIDECEFYLTIANPSCIANDSNKTVGLLGTINFTLAESLRPATLPSQPECWMYVSSTATKSFLYYEWIHIGEDVVGKYSAEENEERTSNMQIRYFMVDECPSYELLKALRVKTYFTLQLEQYDATSRLLTISVRLKSSAVVDSMHPSDVIRNRGSIRHELCLAMKHFYKISAPDYNDCKRICNADVDKLYRCVKDFHENEQYVSYVDPQHPNLIPKLRPYQVAAIQWMLNKEGCAQNSAAHLSVLGCENHGELHCLYKEVKIADGQILYYNHFVGSLIKKKPLSENRLPGGILADEMGLGKTVEVLACILCHPRPALDLKVDKQKKLNQIKVIDESTTSNEFNSDESDQSNASINSELISPVKNNKSNEIPDLLINAIPIMERSNIPVDNILMYPNEHDSFAEVGGRKRCTLQFLRNANEEYFSKSVEQKPFFECICGSKGTIQEGQHKKKVQCEKCGLWQHARCVKYNLDKRKRQSYYCPHCWMTMSCSSRATLIVTPSAISDQWLEEIERHIHTGTLKVLVYNGVHAAGFIQPPVLADNDIVLMTYATMRKELNYVDLPHSNSDTGRRFRNPKRFMAIPSPLVAVQWWRICLDEAQMVESPTAKTAEMALRLAAVNRWCITGTPIQKRINDLYGLLLFLGTDPYCVKFWWDTLLLEPYKYGSQDMMHRIISDVLWRTAKKDVLNQINIPQQTEELHILSFTPVEEHFYRRQHIECSRDMTSRLLMFSSLDVKLNSLDRHTLNQLLAPLLRLRQACCHPQVVRGQFMGIRKTTLTMEELLISLIKKAKVESEEAHRLLVSSLNGLAALHIIKEEWGEAVEKYREVLQSAAELKPQIKTDKLQRLHALHNLAEILEAGHTGIAPTIRDTALRQEAKQLKNKYLKKCLNKVQESREVLKSSMEIVNNIVKNDLRDPNLWWLSIINWSLSTGHDSDLVDKIKNDLADLSQFYANIVKRFRDARGLQFVLTGQLDELKTAHQALSEAVCSLDDEPSIEVVNRAVECHLRPTVRLPSKCIYCEVHELFNSYESKLFSFDEDLRLRAEPTTSEEALMGQLRRGTWADSEMETMLKIILAFARQHSGTIQRSWIEDGQMHIKLFEAMKKEFKALRGVWMQLRDQASAIDELNMATIRLRLRYPDEPKPDPPQLDILEPSEVEQHKLKLMSDRVLGRNELQKKLGQLLYLRNLSKSDYGTKGGFNPDPCPICQHRLGEQWSVLQCGHCFCVECIRILITNYSFGGRRQSLKCAICRQITSHGEISYVDARCEEAEAAQQIKVLGSHSTKIEAVLRKLLQIRMQEPRAKTLVFSTWQDVLDILAKGLLENHINFCMLTNNKFKENLKKFKYNETVQVLLLPVYSGANGLNLIEATHVVLVEPILNPSRELQAIGRVHRIGQTRPTVVHRFMVRGTIEERIYHTLKSHAVNASSHDTEENTITMQNLYDLFVTPDETEI